MLSLRTLASIRPLRIPPQIDAIRQPKLVHDFDELNRQIILPHIMIKIDQNFHILRRVIHISHGHFYRRIRLIILIDAFLIPKSLELHPIIQWRYEGLFDFLLFIFWVLLFLLV